MRPTTEIIQHVGGGGGGMERRSICGQLQFRELQMVVEGVAGTRDTDTFNFGRLIVSVMSAGMKRHRLLRPLGTNGAVTVSVVCGVEPGQSIYAYVLEAKRSPEG